MLSLMQCCGAENFAIGNLYNGNVVEQVYYSNCTGIYQLSLAFGQENLARGMLVYRNVNYVEPLNFVIYDPDISGEIPKLIFINTTGFYVITANGSGDGWGFSSPSKLVTRWS